MGHSVTRSDDGAIPMVTVDGLLADRPALRGQRVIVKIDVEGNETEVIRGMADLLGSGWVAAVIWERGREYDHPEGQERLRLLRAYFASLGFTAWYFESEDAAGPLLPFTDTGRICNVFELAPGISPHASYGLPRPQPMAQPASPILDAVFEARRGFQLGIQAQSAGKVEDALAYFAQAAAADATLSDLYNSLGVMLFGLGRHAAATACCHRAAAMAPGDFTVWCNLGNVLRQQGKFERSEECHARALALAPDHPSVVYNFGLLKRDQGKPEEALTAFERALVLKPDHSACRWDHALALLQKGDYGQGFPAYEARWALTRGTPRKVSLPRWDGTSLEGRSIFLQDEQGFGDILQFARFIPEVRRRGATRVVLECRPELMRLMAMAPGIDTVVPRDGSAPNCDVYAPLLSLPGLLGTTRETLPADVPYLVAPAPAHALPDDGRLKLGLVWAGKATPTDRSCPLELLLPRLGDPRYAVFSLQTGPRADDLKALGGDAFITDLGPLLEDFAETAAILAQLDLLITVDTAAAHLAGALGVPTYLLLHHVSDWRWPGFGKSSPWYPSMTLFRQHRPKCWDGALDDLAAALGGFMPRDELRRAF